MKNYILPLFILSLALFAINQTYAQCTTGLSPNLGFAAATSYTNCSNLTYCGITNGAWIGSGSVSGTVTYVFNPPTSYVEVDFNALSAVTINGVFIHEYLEIWVNGSFFNLNNAVGTTFTNGLPGCNSTIVSYITGSGNTGNSGIIGVIEPLGDNGAGTVKIDFGCELDSIQIRNINVGAAQGSVIQIRRCLDNATGGNCGNCNILVSSTATDPSCKGIADGLATIIPANGTPPYTYVWSNSANTSTASGLAAGTYTVTVTDADNCTNTDSVTVTDPDELSIIFSVSNVSCDSLNNGATTAVNDGGNAPFSYQWDSGQNSSTANNLAVGVYKVTLTDANGCEAKAGVTVQLDDCAPPCPINPCVEAIVNNTDICVVITADPSDPLTSLDCDGDGVDNSAECKDMTDPLDPCDYEDTSITLPVTADQSECPVPCSDLTPVMTILPGNIAGMSAVEVAVQVTELDSVDTDGSIIIVRIPSDPRLVFVWNIGLTLAALVPVQNADWNYLGDNGIVHTWTYNGPGLIIPAKSIAAFGFQSFYDPQSTDGQTTLTATVIPFGGGECNALNNNDSERLVYFE